MCTHIHTYIHTYIHIDISPGSCVFLRVPYVRVAAEGVPAVAQEVQGPDGRLRYEGYI